MRNFSHKYIMINRTFDTRNQLLYSWPANSIIAEVGVFRGEFSKLIHQRTRPKELHLIDLFEGIATSGQGVDGSETITTNLAEEHDKLAQYFAPDRGVKLYRGQSNHVLALFPDSYFDIIYIDADHSYEAMVKDLEVSRRKLKTGGRIYGHDYCSEFPGVIRAVQEFCTKHALALDSLTDERYATFGLIVD